MEDKPLRRLLFVRKSLIDGKQQRDHFNGFTATDIQRLRTLSTSERNRNNPKRNRISLKHKIILKVIAGEPIKTGKVKFEEPNRIGNINILELNRMENVKSEHFSRWYESDSGGEAKHKKPPPARKRKQGKELDRETKEKKQHPSGTPSTCDYFGDGVTLTTKECPECVSLCDKCDVYQHLPYIMGDHKRKVFVKARGIVQKMTKEEEKAREEVHDLSKKIASVSEQLDNMKRSFADTMLALR